MLPPHHKGGGNTFCQIPKNNIPKRQDDMKRIHYSEYMLWGGLLLCTAALFASCSHDELTPGNAAVVLPANQYPLQLQTEIEAPQSRTATGKETWTADGTENIAVCIEDGKVSHYVIAADLSAQPADSKETCYWPTSSLYTVCAWYPYHTETKTFDLSDQTGGYAELDLLYAQKQGSFEYPVRLRFKHQLAKLTLSLTSTDGTFSTDELQNATITIYGDATARRTAKGALEASDATDNEIKPCHDSASNTWEALVVPQDMKDKILLKITIGEAEFVYTPDTGEMGNIQSGHACRYAINVNTCGLEVKNRNNPTWSNGGEENIPTEPVE